MVEMYLVMTVQERTGKENNLILSYIMNKGGTFLEITMDNSNV